MALSCTPISPRRTLSSRIRIIRAWCLSTLSPAKAGIAVHLQMSTLTPLVINVASQCNNTMVFIHSTGVRLVDRWIDHLNITAVIFAHLPGQYSGNSLTETVYGRQSPSGRLPFTVAKNESDYGSLLRPTLPDEPILNTRNLTLPKVCLSTINTLFSKT
jgi:hypothetical protein